MFFFFFSSRRRHTRSDRDWSSDVCSSDLGDNALGGPIEVISADHKNDPALASWKATEFYERNNVDIILDVPTSSGALAIAKVADAQKKLYINITAASTDLTGPQCNKYTFHYAYDTYMLAQGTGTAVVQGGGKQWY